MLIARAKPASECGALLADDLFAVDDARRN